MAGVDALGSGLGSTHPQKLLGTLLWCEDIGSTALVLNVWMALHTAVCGHKLPAVCLLGSRNLAL